MNAANERQAFGNLRKQILIKWHRKRTLPFGPGNGRTPGGSDLRVRYLKRKYNTETTRMSFRTVKSAIFERQTDVKEQHCQHRKARRKKFARRSYLYKMIRTARAVDPACHPPLETQFEELTLSGHRGQCMGKSIISCQGYAMMPNLTSGKIAGGFVALFPPDRTSEGWWLKIADRTNSAHAGRHTKTLHEHKNCRCYS